MANKKITDLIDSGQPIDDNTLFETAEQTAPSTFLSFKASFVKLKIAFKNYFDTIYAPIGGGGGSTNLGYIASPTDGIVTSDTGTDATIPLADGTNAGLLKPAKFTVLENTSGNNTGDQDLSSLAPKDSPTFTTKTTHSYSTASTLASFNASKELVSLDTTTYPTLAQLALLKDLSVSKIKITTSVSITTSTLDASNYSQNGKTVIIDNGVNAINITINSEISASYLKKGTGAITFVQGSGRTLVQVDNTNVMDGAVGSTASVTSDGTTDYLRISNA